MRRITDYIYTQLSGGDNINSDALALILYYKKFLQTYKFLQKSQWWSKEQIKTYQLDKLTGLLNHAYQNVPYYRRLFDNEGIKPKDIQNFEDLKKIPYLTKEIVRKNINDLKATNYPESKFEYITTGGTTGTPLGMYAEKGVWIASEYAFSKTMLDRVGCSLKNKVVILRSVILPSADKGKFWQYSMLGRCLTLSSYHMSDQNLPVYVEKIRAYKPRFITTYPSVITILARYMNKNNIKPFETLKAIVLGAETLYDWQRQLLEETFQCRLINTYGHAERSGLGCICEKSDYYHFFPEYGIVELIGKDNKPVIKENETGEMIVTGFTNFIFPFIRYKTGDIGVYTTKKCICNRNYPLFKEIKGRTQDYVITKDDKLVSISTLNTHSDVFDNVEQFQFYQEKKGEVLLYLVKMKTYTKNDTENIKKNLNEKLGEDFKLSIKFVDKIPRTMRGKHNYLIQKIPIHIERF